MVGIIKDDTRQAELSETQLEDLAAGTKYANALAMWNIRGG